MQYAGLIKPLHSLRGIAALIVVVGHASSMTGIPNVPTAASLGVVLFFALSGFLMGHLYLIKQPNFQNLTSYAFARFGRVYPLFAVLIIIAVALPWILPMPSPFRLGLEDLFPHLLFFGDGRTVWTISVEFQFYAAFTLMWACYFAVPRHRDELFCACTAIYIVTMWLIGFPEGRVDLFAYLHLFLLGIVGAILLRRQAALVESFAKWLLPVLLVGYFAMFVIAPQLYHPRYTYADLGLCVGVLALVLAAAGSPNSLTGRLLSVRPLVFLGEISFGIYLLHRPVMTFWKAGGTHDLDGFPLLAVISGVTILLAWAAHLAIEQPCRIAIRNWGRLFSGRKLSASPAWRGW